MTHDSAGHTDNTDPQSDRPSRHPATDDAPLDREEAVRKDRVYSPGSETETQAKQDDPLPASVDEDIDADKVRAVPGTGGPDDAGDVDVDPDELNLPGRGESAS